MSATLSIWFRGLLRPEVKEVDVVLLDKGKPVNIEKYDSTRLKNIIESINMLWKVPDKSSYWFETEVFVVSSCFTKRQTAMCVTCYQEDMLTNGFKKKMAIPIKYRKKMFDTSHTINVEKVGPLSVIFKVRA